MNLLDSLAGIVTQVTLMLSSPLGASPKCAEDASRSTIFYQITQAVIIEYCHSLSTLDCYAFIRELGRKNDLRSLEMIYSAEFRISAYAASVASRMVDDKDVVSFCAQFPRNSRKWCAAFYSLSARPKAFVIQYIQQVCDSGDSLLRYHCYRVCSDAKWDDLREKARADIDSKTMFHPPQYRGTVSLGDVARQYIEITEKQDKRR